MTAVIEAQSESQTKPPRRLDAVVIGAGVAGIYQLHQLRKAGFNARCYDAATDVGGTWYWNRYPGARFDSEMEIYQYLFDEELYKQWRWSERFPGQAEAQRWLRWICDRLDLWRDMQLATRIRSAHFDESTQRWTVRTETGETIDAQYVITCCGMLSAPLLNQFEGADTFRGQLVYTARWPKEGVPLAAKRVGVIGNGATGIQVIQTIAREVDQLKVFIRTPQYCIPMKNPTLTTEQVETYHARFPFIRDFVPNSFTGFGYDFEKEWAECTPEERIARLESCYQDGSLKLWLASFAEMFFDEDVNEQVSEFVRQKMRARLNHNPALCNILIPQDYGFGTHRVPLDTGYLEAYLRPNVEAVSVKDNPISMIVPEGIQLADGTVHELDVIICATGFDAGTGALTRIDIRGRGGRSLKEDWGRDIRTTLGMMKHGYPNLLMTAVPLAPSAALCNMTTCLQQQTEWITDCVKAVRDRGGSTVEPTEAMEEKWVQHHDETAAPNLISKTVSWYLGSNVEGKPRRVLSYTGGVGTYRQKCNEVAESGYEGLDIR